MLRRHPSNGRGDDRLMIDRVPRLHLQDQDQSLGALRLDGERRHAPGSNRRMTVFHGLLEVLRIMVAPVNDDEVLDPPGDEEIPVGLDEARDRPCAGTAPPPTPPRTPGRRPRSRRLCSSIPGRRWGRTPRSRRSRQADMAHASRGSTILTTCPESASPAAHQRSRRTPLGRGDAPPLEGESVESLATGACDLGTPETNNVASARP